MIDLIRFAIKRHLPAEMLSDEAVVMLLAIGYQESGFSHRRQVRGPARGFWQFEQGGGVAGVLRHNATMDIAANVCADLHYDPDAHVVYNALADNDILAACFARLLLWTLPHPLPAIGDADTAWTQYLECWRPGKPHPKQWGKSYARAIEAMK
ncbi:MAG TPA: hypothetical protein VK991_12950 [Halomonas sp.]|nr:hypothetical protein [Halomonas sp.]